MALARERSISHDSLMMNSINHLSPRSPYSSPDEYEKAASFDQDKGPSEAEDAKSVINFSSFLTNSDQQSLLRFDAKEDMYVTSDQSYQWNHQNPRFSADYSCFQTASDYSNSFGNCANKAKQSGSGSDGSYAWIYSESAMASDHSYGESTTQESTAFNKRLNMGESTQAAKKQCNSSHSATNSKKHKVEKPSVSKDPQSIAAKNRRERISERLKVLQELVPNGTKVDLVTMLEKAISYVKFLQLQVKVLATDEFWPVQGGKAPDISQVREAIDAILSSSQKEKKSSSN